MKKSKVIGEGTQPLVCTPMVGKNPKAVLAELKKVLKKKPDIIEWRADYFETVADTDAVIAFGNKLKEVAGSLPIIFTIRSVHEGGQKISLSDNEVIELCAEICRKTRIEYVDCELRIQPDLFKKLCKIAHENGSKVVASYHNFDLTPNRDVMIQKLTLMEQNGADVAKVAVMPKSLEDVISLLSATLEAKRKLKIPLITMSMGGMGVISRMVGGVFGSSLSFAVGQSSSAPGQPPIEDLHEVYEIINRSMGV
jgi:3-dehydroquinate dehydratase I